MELGVYTFADVEPEGVSGKAMKAHQRIIDLMEEIKLADEVGLDVFGVGEHHRPDFAVSNPATILAGAATITKNIKLASAVSVLSSDDPVRVFQSFATIDLLSSGRAEIMAGRGSFIESYPLFGYNLHDCDALFSEKLELLLQINEKEVVSWNGKKRPSFQSIGIYPRPYQKSLPIWLAVGGTPASAVRAANKGLPMALAIIGGMPERFVPFVNLYWDTARKAENNSRDIKLGINSLGYIAEDSQQAANEYFPSYSSMMNRIGRERGWPPISKDDFEHLRTQKGSLVVGSPQQVIDKILYEYELFRNTRFLLQMSIGSIPHKNVMRSIELFGTKVAPAVKKEIMSNQTRS
jgi:probable LLM family oxidoreductase